MRPGAAEVRWEEQRPDDLASIIFTSGPAVNPRGAMLTHRNFLSNLPSLSEALRSYETDRFVSVLPLHHALEFTGGLLMPLFSGATVTYAQTLKSKVILELMEETGATAPSPVKDEAGRSLASILLLSDGAQTRGLLSPGQGAQRAQNAAIPVFTIALGTESGTILAGPPGQEQLIPVPPDRETLSAIAEYTGAEAFDAESADAVEKVYSGLGSRVGRRDRPKEVTSAFVAAGALLLAGAVGAAMVAAPRLP